MGFWVFMFFMNFLIPAIILGGGLYMWKCPGKINGIIGYRTNLSMKNQETWEFAQKHCGKLWVRMSLVLMVGSCIAMIFFLSASQDTIGKAGTVIMSVQTVAILLSIFPTELALRKRFDKDGNKKPAKQ